MVLRTVLFTHRAQFVAKSDHSSIDIGSNDKELFLIIVVLTFEILLELFVIIVVFTFQIHLELKFGT